MKPSTRIGAVASHVIACIPAPTGGEVGESVVRDPAFVISTTNACSNVTTWPECVWMVILGKFLPEASTVANCGDSQSTFRERVKKHFHIRIFPAAGTLTAYTDPDKPVRLSTELVTAPTLLVSNRRLPLAIHCIGSRS